MKRRKSKHRFKPIMLVWLALFLVLSYFLPLDSFAASRRERSRKSSSSARYAQEERGSTRKSSATKSASKQKKQTTRKPAQSKSNESYNARVVRVVDGDTITVQREGGRSGAYEKIRILGIDAPERSQAWGPEAGHELSKLIHSKVVRIEVANTDRYGRTVAKVWLGKSDIGLEMIRRGMAWHYRQYYDDVNYAKAEKNARAQRLGLWRDESPVEPRIYRKAK